MDAIPDAPVPNAANPPARAAITASRNVMMSDQIEELLRDILSELKAIAEDVSSLKLHSDMADDNSGIVEALDSLGDRITGRYGESLGADLDDVVRALSDVETAVGAR
jgi:hypothetical protein